MNVCIIGSTGHYGYVLESVKQDNDIKITGIAVGSQQEDISMLYNSLKILNNSVQKFDDYKEMLEKLKPDIAVVSCYFGDHAKVALEVLKRKIHLFIEKPVATTLEDLELIKNAHRDSGVNLVAMLAIRYYPWFFTAWKAVKRGAIGTIRLMNAKKSYKLGSRGENFKNRILYGGTIPWVGSHAIDWLYWFSGEKFKSVFASHSSKFNKGHGDLEVSALCQFTLSNEVFGSASIDYLRPKEAPTHDDDGIRIVGTDGVIEVRDRKVYLINNSVEGIQQLGLLPERSIFNDFLMQVRGEGRCMISAEDSFYITEACLKARMSADEKKVVMF